MHNKKFMSNTLITGGRGLVGSAINGGLKPTSNELNLLNYNEILKYIHKNKITKIIHCAAKVGGIKVNSECPADFYYENVLMNTNLLHAAKETGVEKVVSVLSTCIFPENIDFPLKAEYIHDGEPPKSHYAYAYAKRMIEVQSRAYRDQYGCNFITVVPCNIYGPRDNYNLNDAHVIPALIHKFYKAKINNTSVEVWGDGTAQREFVYSYDFARFLVTVLKNYNDPKPIVFSPDTFVKISDVVDNLVEIFNFGGKIKYLGKSFQNGQIKKESDNTKMKEFLSQYDSKFIFTDFREGLNKSVDWFIKNYDIARK